ncbi:MAG: 3',5'-cyclic-AMP phosphodiesterase [Methylococcales bacterium]|nr:3',5'-cyclic-AMP phosphodiesterase [Methylococcales bacterium]MDD5632375.1 3',5'-cyclic-AMP phosphodiesterase [Methylococcales bacterium]
MAPLLILQITDLHILPDLDETFLGVNTERYFHAVLDLAFTEPHHFDLILVTGDLAQEPCAGSYQRILQKLEATNTPCICLPGNHDDYDLMQQVFNTHWVNCRKQVLFENWQLICLNSQIPESQGGRISAQELLFLEDCLTSYPNHHALIAVHHHCLETKSPWMDTMIIENSEAFLAITKRYPQVKAITTGHIHQVMDITTGSIRVLGTPSTCFQFTPESNSFSLDTTAPGYRSIKLYPDGKIESEITRLTGPLLGLQMDTQGY